MVKKLISLWLPVIFWCFLIFFLSSKPTIRTSEIFWWDFAFKKTAHLTEFFILYILTYRAINREKRKDTRLNFFYSLIFIVLYALSDEYHQSFIPGREAKTRDVLIDSFGGLIAIWILKNLLPKAPKRLINWVKG